MSVKNIAADTGILTLSRFSISLTNLIFIPLLTKTLSVDNYGIWVQVWISLPLLHAALDLGLSESMARFFPSEDKKHISSDFFAMCMPVVVLSLFVGLCIALFSGQIGTYIFGGNTTVIRLTALLVPLWVITHFFFGLLRALRRMRTYGISIIAQNIAELGLASAFVLRGGGVEGAVTGLVIAQTVVLIALSILLARYVVPTRPRFDRIIKYLSFGLPLVPMGLSAWVTSYSDRYIIVILRDSAAAGVYDPAYTVGQSVPFLLAGVLGISLLPSLSALDSMANYDDIKDTLSLMFKWFLMATLPFIVGATLLGEEVLLVLTTPTIAHGGAPVMGLIALALTLYGTKIIVSQSLYLKYKTKSIGATYVCSATLNVILTILFVTRCGIIGAAYATVIAYAVDFILTWWLVRSFTLPSLNLVTFGKILVSTATLAVTIVIVQRFLEPNALLLPFIAAVAAYACMTYILGVLTPFEWDLLKQLRGKV